MWRGGSRRDRLLAWDRLFSPNVKVPPVTAMIKYKKSSAIWDRLNLTSRVYKSREG